MTKVIALQGPPASGKDTFAHMLCSTLQEKYQVVPCKASDWLKRTVYSFQYPQHRLVMSHHDFHKMIDLIKDEPFYNTFTFRHAIIDFSENFIKKYFGKDWFGHKNVEEMKRLIESYTGFHGINAREVVFVMSDAGFIEEQTVIQNWVGQSEYTLVQMHRDCTNFSKYSRSYFDLPGSASYKIHNNMGMNELYTEAYELCEKLEASWMLTQGL